VRNTPHNPQSRHVPVSRQGAREGDREEGEAEPGELPPHERKRRRRSHEAIVWATPGRPAGGAEAGAGRGRAGASPDDRARPGADSGAAPGDTDGVPRGDGGGAPTAARAQRSATERAAAELEAFAAAHGAELELDPDAPPAIKASPSVSPGDAGAGSRRRAGRDPCGAAAGAGRRCAAAPCMRRRLPPPPWRHCLVCTLI